MYCMHSRGCLSEIQRKPANALKNKKKTNEKQNGTMNAYKATTHITVGESTTIGTKTHHTGGYQNDTEQTETAGK